VTELLSKIRKNLPIISDRKLEEAIAEHGELQQLKAGTILMDYNQNIRHIPIVLHGLIKVMTQGEDGDDILLYYLSGGSTCPTAFTCCMANKQSEIKAIVEEDSEIIVLPTRFIDEWMVQFPSWKNFIMNSYSIRFKELLGTIDDIAFSKIDDRLVKYLAKKSALINQRLIQTTHQQIANDLHTSREAISRLLKKMEKMGYLKLGRNKITIIKLPQ
jgi:CRP/FNR family transcriptional regulator